MKKYSANGNRTYGCRAVNMCGCWSAFTEEVSLRDVRRWRVASQMLPCCCIDSPFGIVTTG